MGGRERRTASDGAGDYWGRWNDARADGGAPEAAEGLRHPDVRRRPRGESGGRGTLGRYVRLVAYAVVATVVVGAVAASAFGYLPGLAPAFQATPPDAIAQVAGAEPAYADRSGDRLLTNWEREERHPTGAALPGADEDRMDLYVQLHYGAGIEPLSDEELAALERIFASMPVENPDGSTGVRLHVVEERRLDHAPTFGPDDERQALRDRYYVPEHVGAGRCVHHQVVLGEIDRTDSAGFGSSPGYFAFVDGTATRDGSVSTVRVETAVHELLHNVVGELPGGEGVTDDGHHTTEGWLSQHHGEPYLSGTTATRLQRNGFATPSAFSSGRC